MSHVVTCEVEVLSLSALKKAVEKLGWEFKEGCTKHRWYSRWVDDSPVPRNLFEKEEEYQRVIGMARPERCAYMKTLLDNCDHVIHIPGYNYEIGVFKVGKTYQLSYDWVGDVTQVLGSPKGCYKDVINPLPQAYAIEATKESLSQEGWSWEEWKDQNNNYHIKAVQYT